MNCYILKVVIFGQLYCCLVFFLLILNKNVFKNCNQRLNHPKLKNYCNLNQVTDDEIEEAFKMFDRDNSGTINHNEIK